MTTDIGELLLTMGMVTGLLSRQDVRDEFVEVLRSDPQRMRAYAEYLRDKLNEILEQTKP